MDDGVSQVEFAASFLEGNALLWYLSYIDFGRSFSDWNSLKNTPGEALRPFNTDEEYRLALFSLSQNWTLDAYIGEFTRLSLSVADLDQLSQCCSLAVSLKVCAVTECGGNREIFLNSELFEQHAWIRPDHQLDFW